MLTFKPITMREAATLRRYYESCGFQLCEYSAGVKLMWRKTLNYAWTEAAGCLIIRCESQGRGPLITRWPDRREMRTPP